MRTGLKIASVYCAYVTVLYLLTGAQAFEDMGVTLPAILAVYLLGGVVGGGVVGLLLPIAQSSLVGAIMIGVFGMIPVVTGVAISIDGFPPWNSDTTEAIVFISLILGAYGGYLLRASLQRRARGERGGLNSDR
jgi:hypothetical protein